LLGKQFSAEMYLIDGGLLFEGTETKIEIDAAAETQVGKSNKGPHTCGQHAARGPFINHHIFTRFFPIFRMGIVCLGSATRKKSTNICYGSSHKGLCCHGRGYTHTCSIV